VHTGSEHNPGGAPRPELPPALLTALPPTEQPALHSHQLLLTAEPRSICHSLGLNWWAAVQLFEEGWLSFSPEAVTKLDESQEAELVFVGSLVVAGCDRRLLVNILSGLSKPYAYDLRRIYYDWAARDWRIFPDPHAHPESVFSEWLDMLVKRKDAEAIAGILELAAEARERLRGGSEPLLTG
jgi:hypothetical protein